MRTGIIPRLRKPSRFNSKARGGHPGSIPETTGAMFRQPSTTIILDLVAIGLGIVSLMRITAFCTVSGLGLSSDYDTIILSSVAAVLSKRVDFTWSP